MVQQVLPVGVVDPVGPLPPLSGVVDPIYDGVYAAVQDRSQVEHVSHPGGHLA